MKNKILKIICLFLVLIVLSSILIVFFIPSFQFRTYQVNRVYGITFGFISSILFLILFWIINEIKIKGLKIFLIFTNGFLLFFAIGNLTFYYFKIDPDIQFRDSKVLFINELNPNEKIISQYYVNWKTNQKKHQNNRIENIWVFRYYKSYNIDTLNLEKNWRKKITTN